MATAHEFWLQAQDYQIAPDDTVVADIRIGQEFKGSSYTFFPRGFRRFDIALGDMVVPVAGRLGDQPAAQVAPLGEGLNILVHETTDMSLTYSDWSKFTNFVTHKDFAGALAAHAARGLPQTGFGEAYSRYAKALIGVGDAAGQDRAFGLETEIVALANPYTDDLSQGMAVRVLYRGAPRPDAQVELFAMTPDGEVDVTLHRTDAQGVAVLPVKPQMRYMVDAVVLREPSAELAAVRNVVWESLWANLSFAVPAR